MHFWYYKVLRLNVFLHNPLTPHYIQIANNVQSQENGLIYIYPQHSNGSKF